MVGEPTKRGELGPKVEGSFHASDLVLVAVVMLCLLWRAPGLEFYYHSPDHGYQLSLGRQITLGKFPFVDMFFHYGPLTALTSAIGIWLSGSLLGETLICVIGYTAALFLVFALVRAHASTTTGLCATIFSFLMMSRFYKWYYWLFPLLSLYIFHRALVSKKRDIGYVFCFGIICLTYPLRCVILGV
jgi:hypothetical protein